MAISKPSSPSPTPLIASSSTGQGMSFTEYLQRSEGLDERYELINGQLVEMPPESIANLIKANRLLLALVQAGVSIDLIFTGRCEVQVPILQAGDAANRYPDLVVVDALHIPLMAKRATVTLDMPPPCLVVEVVSPGAASRERDYKRKRSQYAAIGISEYWIIDPEKAVVKVLTLGDGEYMDYAKFAGEKPIQSPGYPALTLTAAELLK